MPFGQLANVADCMQSVMSAQKCRHKISEFWPKFTSIIEQQTKFVLIPYHRLYFGMLMPHVEYVTRALQNRKI